MSTTSGKYSLRNLRLATAASLLTPSGTSTTTTATRSSITNDIHRGKTTAQRNFLSAPAKTLALSDIRSRDTKGSSQQQPTAGRGGSNLTQQKESRRARKKREWLSRRRSDGTVRTTSVEMEDNREQSRWAYLPDLVLELIFQMLPYETKQQAALTCPQWSRAAKLRSVWSDMVVHDHSMTRSRFNFAGKFYESRLDAGLTCRTWSRLLYVRSTWSSLDIRDPTLRNAGLCRYKFNYYAKEDEDILDSVRASNALHRVGLKLRHLSFLPQKNLHNICQFMRMLTKFCEMQGKDKGGLPDIESFRYVFPCDFARQSNEVDIYGTGGMILQDMKDLLTFLPGIKRLELIDLELDGDDASHVLDEVSEVCCTRLQYLSLVNTSRRPYSLLAVASFVNLRCLVISPHNLCDDLVECIGDMPKLRNLQLLTNSYTECVPTPVDYRVWQKCRKSNPKLRVHLITEGNKNSKELTFQSKAPVKSVVYDTPCTRASTFAINLAVELYKTDLECYAHKRLPRFHMSRSFHDRPDSAYLYLVRECPYIHTLMIREKISSSTVLLLAYTGKNLRYFHIRRNAVLLKCEWPKNPEWSWEFYKWLKKNSRTYEDMEREVSQILGFRWYALNDKQFKLTPLNLNIPYYYEGFEETG